MTNSCSLGRLDNYCSIPWLCELLPFWYLYIIFSVES